MPQTGPPDARARLARIHAFREELASLIEEGALLLTPDQLARINAAHAAHLALLAGATGADSPASSRTGPGTRLAALIAAVAVSAALFLLVRRVWGVLATPVQVSLLCALPPAAVVAVWAAERRRSLEFLVPILAVVAFGATVLNVQMLGFAFAVEARSLGLLAYGAVALGLAYAHGVRVLLVAAIVLLCAWFAAFTIDVSGHWWAGFYQRPESVAVAGMMAFAASFLPHPTRSAFPAWYRGVGLFITLLALLVLGEGGHQSWWRVDERAVAATYQVLIFVVAIVAFVAGGRRQWPEVTAMGALGVIAALFSRYVDWWWDTLPAWLFFLIVGITAILCLAVAPRIRWGRRPS